MEAFLICVQRLDRSDLSGEESTSISDVSLVEQINIDTFTASVVHTAQDIKFIVTEFVFF